MQLTTDSKPWRASQTRISTSALIAEIKQCGKTNDLERGKLLHHTVIEAGCYKSVSVYNTLISMYSKCGDIFEARAVFDNMRHRDVVSWTALIVGYVDNGEISAALELFDNMDCSPNSFTFAAALKACTRFPAGSKLDKETYLRKGMNIHRQARELGFDKDMVVSTTLVSMYSKYRDMAQARSVFDGMTERNVVSWTALIAGYVENGESLAALDLFRRMNCAPNPFTLAAVLKACTTLATGNKLDKETCLEVHGLAKELGLDKDVGVSNALIDMYCKAGDIVRARFVFDRMTHRDVVSWTSLILGYVDKGESMVALDVFNRMNCTPDRLTFVAVLKACTSLGSLRLGQRAHRQVCKVGLEVDEVVSNALMDFYCKCGKVDAAERVFNGMNSWNTVAWTALMGGYSSLGHTSQVFSLVTTMEECGAQLNAVTVQLVLTACSHAGRVEEGRRCFRNMSKYGLKPTAEHYGCMVDMLTRANKPEEALALVKGMHCEANHVVWTALLRKDIAV